MGGMAIRLLTADDVELYREIRLAALRTDPGAFGSNFDREAAFDEATWRRRLTVGPDGRPLAVFVDEVDNGEGGARAVGTAGIVYTEWDTEPMIIGMWVRPEARGLGAGRRLVEATVGWAVARNEPGVLLWVVKGNDPALALYRACGFTATGNTDTVPSNPDTEELEMRLALDPATASVGNRPRRQ